MLLAVQIEIAVSLLRNCDKWTAASISGFADVAEYFGIVELAGILEVDHKTFKLAISNFCRTANNTCQRNSNIKSILLLSSR